MIPVSHVETCKLLAEAIAQHMPGRVQFAYAEGNTVTWVAQSAAFDIKVLYVGHQLGDDSTSVQAMRENRVVMKRWDPDAFGTRMKIVSVPVVNKQKVPVGAFTVIFPVLHPVADAFHDMAPILAGLFNEGAFLFMTDLEEIRYRQSSDKFDIPSLPVGYRLSEGDVAAKAIKKRQPIITEIDEARYGVPVSMAVYPLFDEENKEKIVATFGLVTPKTTAVSVRQMAADLKGNLSNISAAVEELAASATEIHNNERDLNETIQEIVEYSEKINEISLFIKDIADETKLLGLNAATWAARACDAGRGFGVVAEEIRKLSDQSKSTVPKINEFTSRIKKIVEIASEKSRSSLVASQEQASATEEVTAGLEEITAMSEKLSQIAGKL